MTDPEIREWLDLLDSSPEAQLRIVEDLLDNTVKDGMTDEDRTVCLRAKELLHGKAEDVHREAGERVEG